MTIKGLRICWFVWSLTGFWSNSVYAQNFAYSQYWQAPFTSNPAFIAQETKGQISALYRYQSFDVGNPISSFFISGSYPLFRKRQDKPWANIGLTILHDSEANFIKSNGFYLTWSNSILFRRSQISLAAQLGHLRQNASLDNAITNSTIQQGAPDGTALLGNRINFDRQNFSTLGFGGLWEYFDLSGLPRFSLGIAGFHLNRPEIGFLSGIQKNVPIGFNTHAQMHVHLSPHLNLRPNGVFSNSANFQTWQLGSWLDIHANLPGKLGAHRKGSLGLGLWYHSNEALIWGVQYEEPNYVFTLSWDAPLNSQEGAWLGDGAIEFSIKIKFNKKREKPLDLIENAGIDTDQLRVVWVPKLDTSTLEVSDTVHIRTTETASISFPTKVIRFDLAQKNLTSTSVEILEYVSQLLEIYPLTYIDVSGFSCNLGHPDHNHHLSMQRALAVKQYLIDKGIEAEKIHIQAWGDKKPMVPNLNETNRRLNRRVEIKPKLVE